MESFEVSGQWWLPENPDNKVAGTLVVAEDGSSELQLIGSLRSYMEGGESVTENGHTVTTFSQKSLRDAGVYPRIHGFAGGKSFTLDDCFQTHWSSNLFGGGLDSQRIHVYQVFRGVLFEQGEKLEFTTLFVTMDWLAYWVQRGGISEEVTFKEAEASGLRPIQHVLTIKPVEDEVFSGLKGTTIKLRQSYGLDGDNITEKRLSQDFLFAIEADGLVPLSDLLSQAGALQDLVSMGTGKVAAFKEVKLRHPDVTQTLGDKTREVSIDLFAQWQVTNGTTPKNLTSYDMPFSLGQLGGVEKIGDWLSASELHQAAVSRVMATRYGAGSYVGDSFMNCAAALEGYDREKHGSKNKKNYVDRVKRCVAHAGPVFAELVGDTDAWAKAVRDKRNDVAHHKVGVEAASTEQLLLSKSAYWLFVLCLLRDAGAPDVVFDNIRQHSAFAWLQAQLADLSGIS